MINEKELAVLIKKYQNGRCSPDELKLIENYLNSFQDSQNEWDETTFGKKNFVEEKLFAKIQNQIAVEQKQKSSRYVKPNFILRVAASLAFIFVLGFTAYYFFFTENQKSIVEVKWNEKKTKIGEKSIITFLDGTKITLNADSKLKYSLNSESNLREVYLEGEAYFEVAPNKEKPFVVHSSDLSTIALGTKFNVKAFAKEKEIVVSLVEGRIKVTSNDTTEQILNHNQQFTYNVKTGKHKVKSFDVMQVIGWRDNILIFDNAVLEDALVIIERAYGVKFELTDESIKNLKIKANFENESIWTIVKVLKKAFGLDYLSVREDDRSQKIVFFKKRL